MGPIEDGGGATRICSCGDEGGVCALEGGNYGRSDASDAPLPLIRYRKTSNHPVASLLKKKSETVPQYRRLSIKQTEECTHNAKEIPVVLGYVKLWLLG
jgi:hypothetical protein